MAGESGFLLLRHALLVRVSHAGRRRAGVEDLPAEIPGKRRAQSWYAGGKAGIVMR